MDWYEITLNSTKEASDAISDIFFSLGANGVSVYDPDEIKRESLKSTTLDYADDRFIDSLGDKIIITAYLANNDNINKYIEVIEEGIKNISKFLPTIPSNIAYKIVNDEEWANTWKKYYKPFYIADGILIKPTWEECNINQNDIVIEMEPGMAFGTGTHETTKMCALLLKKYIKEGMEVIDVGTGTGILSIISSKLGAKKVVSLDVDEIAIKVAKENFVMNDVENNITTFCKELVNIKKEKADVIVANIIADVIIDLAQVMARFLKEDAVFITSGIIKERKQQVIEAYNKIQMDVLEILEIGEWVAIAFKCQSSLLKI